MALQRAVLSQRRKFNPGVGIHVLQRPACNRRTRSSPGLGKIRNAPTLGVESKNNIKGHKSRLRSLHEAHYYHE